MSVIMNHIDYSVIGEDDVTVYSKKTGFTRILLV